jgi:DNA helicase HerA-like ATPase
MTGEPMSSFIDTLSSGYGFADPAITLGAAIEHGITHPEPKVRLPLAMLNRHGLVAGATGTGKTRTLQLMAEQLSNAGVPVFISDIKGDLQGLAVPGEGNARITARAENIGYEWKPAGSPVEFVSLSGKLGAQLRATVSSFGPLLLAKVLELNETQSSVLAMVFKYCDDHGLLLLDFSDLRAVLQFLTSDEGKDELREYGALSRASVGVLLRKMVQLEEQGAEQFFGEPEFDVHDLLARAPDGRGIITCLEVADIQDKPALYSTFMMWLLARLYHTLPEEGDLPKPKLAFFFDEAHLLFDDAPKAFLDQVEQVVRLIRSKGVGIFFVTQTPKDVPSDVLAQLGNRVQHALRAHTPDDEAALRATARTYPKTEFYDLEETLTTLGTGEAVVSGLDPRGVPTPVVACRLIPPATRMDTLTPEELKAELAQSDLMREYGTPVDRESAREMLERRVNGQGSTVDEDQLTVDRRPSTSRSRKPTRDSAMQTATKRILGAMGTSVGRAVGNAVVRGLLGALGVRATRRTTRTRSWF